MIRALFLAIGVTLLLLAAECSLLDLRLEGAVLSIGLDRTEVYNALDPELIEQLIDVLDWASTHSAGVLGSLEDDAGNPLPRVLVLNGKGKHFCAGADFAHGEMTQDRSATSAKLYREAMKLFRAPVPVVAALPAPMRQSDPYPVSSGLRDRLSK